jgi:starvation-inducible outer membrane lipoprotein
MTKQISKMTMSRLALASVCCLCLAGCAGSVALGPDAVKGKTPDGFIEMHEVQAAYIGVPLDGPYKPDHYRY